MAIWCARSHSGSIYLLEHEKCRGAPNPLYCCHRSYSAACPRAHAHKVRRAGSGNVDGRQVRKRRTRAYQGMGRAAAGGGECGVVGERRRGDVEQRDAGGEEEEQERRCRRQSGATRARARVVPASAPRLGHLQRVECASGKVGGGAATTAVVRGAPTRRRRRHGMPGASGSVWV
jgi:hypothetical protein